jgi:hypothetical protein
MWMRRDDSYGVLIPPAQFAKAQEIIEARYTWTSEENLLTRLRQLWAKHGRLSTRLIEADKSVPSASVFRKRFRFLTRAYSLIGYDAKRNYRYNLVAERVREQRRELRETVKAKLRSYGATVEHQAAINVFLINGQFTISVVLCYCSESHTGNFWRVRFNNRPMPDITLVARLGSNNNEILDYFLFPSVDRFVKRIFLTENNSARLEVYRFESLDFFMNLARRNVLVQKS